MNNINTTIELLKEEHAQISFKWRNDPQIWEYTFNKPDKNITVKDELDWIRKVLKNIDERRFAIYFGSNYVGNVYLTSITKDLAYFGIFIGDKNYWGKGIAKKATKLILNFAKVELNLKEIYLRVKKENIIAFKLYEKFGFQVIEVNKDHYKMKLSLDNYLMK